MSNLFRRKSLERISSPEQLNTYIRVSTPSVWLLLAAITALLAGVCVWGVFGHMETTLTVAALVTDDGATAYVRVADADKIAICASVTVAGTECEVLEIASEPVQVDETFTDYMRHMGSLQEGEWVLAIKLDADLPEGVYEAHLVTDSVSPMSFVLN